MRLRIAEPEIDRNNPFINDKLNRIQSAGVLTQLFSNIEGQFVVSLNSSSGTGKTTFIKMFRQHLSNEGFPTIYFNAWETDYQDNPLIAFIGEIDSGVDELEGQGFDIKTAKKILNKIRKTGKDILKKSIPVAVKTAAQKGLDMDKGFEDAFFDFTSAVIENQIKNYSLTKEQIKKFREQLKELVNDLQKPGDGESKRPRPLVFFIDELDRCRPDYAIQIIEKIRHFLDVEGIIVVLGMDMDQLGYSVKTVYGQNMKERGYLRRFIDLEYNLPADNYISELYCRYLSSETAITGVINRSGDPDKLLDELNYSSTLMASSFALSLRDLNILFNSVYLVFLAYENIKTETVALSVLLITLKMRNTALFNKIINRERTVFYVINELAKMKKQSSTMKEQDKYYLERRLSVMSLKKFSDDEYRLQVQANSVSGNSELNNIYKVIKDRHRLNDAEIFTETLFNKIKLLDSFKFPEERG